MTRALLAALAAALLLALPCGCMAVPDEVEAALAPPDGRRPNNFALREGALERERQRQQRGAGEPAAPPQPAAGEDARASGDAGAPKDAAASAGQAAADDRDGDDDRGEPGDDNNESGGAS